MNTRTYITAESSVPVSDTPQIAEIAASWLLGFGLVLFMAANGGGHGVDFFGQIGILGWLILVLGAAIGLFPSSRPGRQAWISIGLLAALAAWAAIGLFWTDSPDKTMVEIARLSTYAAIFALGLASRGREGLPHQIGAIGVAIVVVAAIGLLSRFQPDLFPSATETGQVLTSEAARLSFPLNYWNGLGALLALGLAPVLQIAGGARNLIARVAATGAIPILLLALYVTYSRAGLLASTVAVIAFFALTTQRLGKLPYALVGFIGGAVLVLLTRARPDIREGLTGSAAHQQGDELTWITLLVCLITAGVAWGIARLLRGRKWQVTLPERRQLWIGLAVVAALVVVGSLAAGVPDKMSSNWESFKSSETPSQGSSRISAANGNGRYQLWSSGLRQFESAPIAGRGAGTFEYWWAEKGDRPGFVRDAHSLPVQTLGESGAVGFLLLVGFMALVLIGGIARVTGSRDERAGWLAAAIAGCLAFATSASLDWIWQIPAVVVAFLLLAATIISQSGAELQRATANISWRPRLVLSGLAVAGLLLLVVPVTSALLLDRSRDLAREGDLKGALEEAQHMRAISPGTAAPLIQKAGLLEALGKPKLAIGQAEKATEIEPANWRNWLILSGIRVRAGETDQALQDFREARRLNPRSSILNP